MSPVAFLYALAYVLIDSDRAGDLYWPTAVNWLVLSLPPLYHAIALYRRDRDGERWKRAGTALGRSLCTALAVVAAMLLLRTALRPLEASGTLVPLLAHPAAWVLSVFGSPSAAEGSQLFIEGYDENLVVAVGVDKLSLIPMLLALTAWMLTSTASLGRRGWGLLAAGFVAIVTLRLTAVAALLAQQENLFNSGSGELLLSIVGSRFLDGAALLLLTYLLAKLPRAAAETSQPWLSGLARPATLAGAACLGAAWFALHLDLPGAHKDGLILFDDHHVGTWGRSDRQMNTEWYGDYSTYNLNSALEWLGHRYPAAVNRDMPLSDELLDDVSVLVLKTPSKAYEPEEVEAIHRFVERGGGLLAIGDHTDLHGMNTHLNSVIGPMGMRLNFDAVSDAGDGAFNVYTRPTLTPATAHLAGVDYLQFMTGCSISSATWPTMGMLAPRCSRDAGDYSRGSNFGTLRSDPASAVGPAILSLARSVGNGRVVVFSDSTIFSSYSTFKRGHDDYLLSAVSWLYRESNPFWNRVASLLGWISALALLFLVRRESVLWILAIGGLFMLGSRPALNAFHARAFAPVAPDAELQRADILWVGGQCAVPTSIGGIGSLDPKVAFDTLTTDIARTGLWPRVVEEYEDEIPDDVAVIFAINPVWTPPQSYIDAVRAWVSEGGTLVVVDPEESSSGSSSGELLGGLGLATWDSHEGHDHRPRLRAVERESDIDWFEAELGEGWVVYAQASEKLSRVGLGHSFTLPNAERRARLADLYALLQSSSTLDAYDRRYYDILESEEGASAQ